MGCGCAPEVLENREKEINLNSNFSSHIFSSDIIKKYKVEGDLNSILFLKISNLILNNPFYNISLSDFEHTINSLQYKLNQKQELNTDNIIDNIISKYLDKEEYFVKILFKDVVKYAITKFKIIKSDKNDNTFLILIFLYIFLSNKQPGKKQLFKEKVKILLNNAKSYKENEFNISLLFDLIINIIQMFTFSFGSFFIFFGFLDNFNDYDKTKFEEIINNKKSKINEVQSVLNENLTNLNKNYSPYFLNLLVMSEINNKIKFIFENIRENQELIILEDYEINIIIDSLFESTNINNILEILFFGENHDY